MLLENVILEPVKKAIITAIKDKRSFEEIRTLASLYEKIGDVAVWSVATVNRVHSIVAHALMDALGEDNVLVHWRQAHEESYKRISAYMAELDRVAVILAEEGIPLIVIENAAIAKAVHPCPGCFQFGDLDVLIAQEHHHKAVKLLLCNGYYLDGNDNQTAEADLITQNNGRLEFKTSLPESYSLRLNIQWSLVARRWFSSKQEPTISELFSRSISVSNSDVRLLCPEDNLLQLCMHNSAHSYVRKPGIRLHLDVERIVRRVSINWDIFVERVLALKVKTPVYFSLAIPKSVFQTPIPDSVLTELSPPRWKKEVVFRWLDRIGLFNPDKRKFGRIGFIIFSALLYDDMAGLLKSIFPDSQWMRERYRFESGLLLPYYHVRRLFDLTIRRVLS